MNIPAANEHGEIAGCGPEWACDQHGHDGHDYQQCEVCWANYHEHLGLDLDRPVTAGVAA